MAGPFEATVEDYHSDNSEGHIDDFRRSPVANVAAKRSHPSDLGSDTTTPVEKVVQIDLQSDSGYSSHTAATSNLSSADSAPSVRASQSPPSAPPSVVSQPPPSPIIKRRPTISDDRKNSSQGSPRRAPQRSGSVSTRKPRERRQTASVTEDCTDPNCKECPPRALVSARGRRPDPLDSALDISYNARSFDQRPQHSDSAPMYTSPQSPTYNRPGPYTMQNSAVIQPAQSARRRSSSNARPVSFHGGDPGSYYAAAGLQYPNLQDLRGPPPSMSAHFTNMHPSQMPSYMQPPPQPTYYLGHPMQTPTPYDTQVQRPPMPSRTSSNYNTRGRPVSGYGPTVITQEKNVPSMPSARYASAPQSARERLAPAEFDSESSDYASSDEEEEEEEEVQVRSSRNDRTTRALMPPPPPPTASAQKAITQRRPSLRHAATTQVYNADRRMSQSQTLPERPRERDPRDSRSSRGSTVTQSRPASVSRPALVHHPKAQSAFESARNAQIVVENSRSQRRQSYYESDEKERRRANRNSRMYADDIHQISKALTDNKRSSKIYTAESNQDSVMYDSDAIIPTRRRQTDSDIRRREEHAAEAKNIRATMDAEAYLRSTRGSNDPLIDKVHKAAKRASRIASGPSEAESSRSKSDKASRLSVSNRTTVTNSGNNGEIRLRVDASAPLSLQFNGDMDGRTLQINPTEDGMADIVIGNPGSRSESTYRSERGSVLGGSRPKAIMAGPTRREPEESSARSHPGRREGERRVLQRRRRDFEYN